MRRSAARSTPCSPRRRRATRVRAGRSRWATPWPVTRCCSTRRPRGRPREGPRAAARALDATRRRRRAGDRAARSLDPWPAHARDALPVRAGGELRRVADLAGVRDGAHRRPHQVRGFAGAGAVVGRLRRAGRGPGDRAPRAVVPSAAARACAVRLSAALQPPYASLFQVTLEHTDDLRGPLWLIVATYRQALWAASAAVLAVHATRMRDLRRALRVLVVAAVPMAALVAGSLHRDGVIHWPYDAHPVLLGAGLLLMREAFL